MSPPSASAAGSARLIVVTGPTGTGKSELGIAIAERIDGEVVNADSMQLYRGMDIGTAKVPVGQRRGIPHHLLDVLDVTQHASVAAYQAQARDVIETVLAAGRSPILVGGSGLYVQAVIDDIRFPGTDPAIRQRLTAELETRGIDVLRERLARLDPAAALAIEANNGRRIVRALEVIELTGEPFTATMPRPGPPRYDAALLCLDRDAAALDERLATRMDAMMAAGFLDEVRRLEAHGLRAGMTASRALGYRQLLDVLDGTAALDRAVADTVTATRRFVRRQRSWWRRDQRLSWLDAAAPDLVDRALRIVGRRPVGWNA